MAERYVDAALAGDPATNVAYFFITDQYVIYDWVTDRVRDGVHGLEEWGFPLGFAPPGPSTSLDTGLRGKGPYLGYAYFFRGSEYVRYNWTPPGFDPPHARSIALWNLPADFTTIDAAFNGALNREPYCYLFKGARYVRYIWATDAVDTGYPKPISNMIGIPSSFAAGLDAAVDGGGPFSDAGYMFKDEYYLRFQWVAGADEPHGAGVEQPIQGNWPGLAELLLAAKAKSQALEWLRAAMSQLTAFSTTLAAGVPYPFDLGLMNAALQAHFRINPADPPASKLPHVTQILTMYTAVMGTLQASATTFRFRTDAEAVADGLPGIDAAYASLGGPINFTRNFVARPERNRVSSVIHEAVHVHDAQSGLPATHISEWYVTAPLAAALGLPFQPDRADFATRYDEMTTANALHNPSSYATFARHIFFHVDNRELP